MNSDLILFNLLPYRPEPTGLSRYVQRLLAAWPTQTLPKQLRLSADGTPEVCRSRDLPKEQRSAWMRFLQAQALVQHGVPVRRLLASDQPERLYSPYTDWLWAFPRVPQVITCHDLTPVVVPNSLRAHWRSRFWLPRHLERASLVVAISQSVADQLVESGLPARRITVVRNGVEPIPDPITAPTTSDCVMLARHARNKNVGLALDGWSKFLARAPQWSGRLVVVGAQDRCTGALRRQERELGLEGRVTWIEMLSDQELQALLRRAFCLISSSLMEGFDYPLLEAQALGLPTLASRIPVHEELHRDVALLFDLTDHGDSMAQQLYRLSREHSLWCQLSRAGLRNAAFHTSTRQVCQLHRLLQEPLP